MIKTQDGITTIGNIGAITAIDTPAILEGDALRARAAYAQLPDLRLDKVFAIRRRMASGLFDPTAEELAGAILASAARSRLCRY